MHSRYHRLPPELEANARTFTRIAGFAGNEARVILGDLFL
jgi:hypothetical protein